MLFVVSYKVTVIDQGPKSSGYLLDLNSLWGFAVESGTVHQWVYSFNFINPKRSQLQLCGRRNTKPEHH
jgi:hypothetical protein